jgi:hypothetical protein
LACVGSQREIMDELYAKINENPRKTINGMKAMKNENFEKVKNSKRMMVETKIEENWKI